jgi:hypothetical protein
MKQLQATNTFPKQSQAMKRLAIISDNEKIATSQDRILSQMKI